MPTAHIDPVGADLMVDFTRLAFDNGFMGKGAAHPPPEGAGIASTTHRDPLTSAVSGEPPDELEGAHVTLRLYVAGDTGPSVQARRQLETLRARLDAEGVDAEVVDVFDRPDLAEADRILATPVLIRLRPAPNLTVIGDLSDWRAVARILDLPGGSQ